MSPTCKGIRSTVLLLGSFAVLFAVAQPTCRAYEWHTELYLGRGGWWSQRLPLTITNQSSRPLNGSPMAVTIGGDQGTTDLVGASANALRVCDAHGIEVLWRLVAADGHPVESGLIPERATLTIPVECPAHTTVRYFVYFNNPDAWPVPDFLPYQAGITNGGFEQSQNRRPAGWDFDAGDSMHRASWSDERPHYGGHCLKTVVSPGATPTWIGVRQRHIYVTPGASYRLTAWVRADQVQGWAGWFVHAGNQSQPQLLNRSLDAGDGSFDWQRVSTTLTVPAEADQLTIGTVLRGTGTAWYDDVQLEMIDDQVVSVHVGTVEQRELKTLVESTEWPSMGDQHATWELRVPLRVTNATDTVMTSQMWSANLAQVLHGVRRAGQAIESMQVLCGGQRVPHRMFDDAIVFEADVAPRATRSCWVYFGQDAADSDDPTPFAGNGLFAGKNLAANSGFETQASLGGRPSSWTTQVPAAGARGLTASLDSPGYTSNYCVKLQVPRDTPSGWYGWRQDVPIEAGSTYLFGAWVRCQDVMGDVRLHGHIYDKEGKVLVPGGFTSVGQPLTGTTDWTWLWGTIRMPAGAADYHMHLTMNATGTVWHDGVVIRQIQPATVGQLESRASIATDLQVWQVNAVAKVFREDPPPRSADARPVAHLHAARNEYEPLQLAVRSSATIEQMQVIVDPPRHATGVALKDISVGVVGFVPVDYPTSYYRSETPLWHRKSPTQQPGCDGWSGWWPDPLLPTDTFKLTANQTQPVWLTVHVPPGSPAGEYRGEVRFVKKGAGKWGAGESDVARIPIEVDVWDFDLPKETHLKAIYDVRFSTPWWTDGSEGRAHATSQLWEMLAQRRISAHEVYPAPTFNYRDGVATADFSEFDHAAERYFDQLGMTHAYTPWHFYGFGWGHPPKTLYGVSPFAGEYPYTNADRTILQADWKRAYQACLRLFWEHVKAKGWADRITLYISDEPHFEQHSYVVDQMRALCTMIHEVDPEIPIYSSTWHHLPDWDGYLDTWGIGHDGRVTEAQMDKIRAGGAKVWFTTDGQQCLDTPYCAVERLLPHYCFKYQAEAYEFWGVSWHTFDPYRWGWHRYIDQSSEPGVNYYIRYPNGDGYLIYPPLKPEGLPVTSIRLEQAREGMEDYEYLRLLTTLVERANDQNTQKARRALQQAADLVAIPNAGGRYATKLLDDPDEVFEVRRAVGNAIEELVIGQ
ncbi:MAG: DUF4091 domain-containing protein [Planctomycetales bacterium]|nr:DUF4091 domain-containing protein [Planctomycetales bacterium]